jgi:hypothetical protein
MGCAGWVLDSNSVAEVTTTADDTIPHVNPCCISGSLMSSGHVL